MNRVLDYLRGRSAGLAADADAALLDRFLADRDEVAFAELVRRHGSVVWGACRRVLADPRDAEDAFQATFLVLVRRASVAAREPVLAAWLYRVAALTARNLRRGNLRRAAVSGPLGHDVPASDTAVSQVEARFDLDAALLGLPEKYRAAVVLFHLQGLTRQEAAERLGCPEGTLSALLSRARAKLRARLGDAVPAALAVGAAAVPAGLSAAAVRSAVIYTTSTLAEAGLSPAVLATTDGVLRMFRMKKLRLVAAGLLVAVVGAVWLATGVAARPIDTPADPPAKPTAPPTLTPGKWALIEHRYAADWHEEAVLTIAEKDGKPTITAVEGDTFEWQGKGLTVAGRRVTFALTRNGSYTVRFDGLLDPADPTRVRGSLGAGGTIADRATLELVPPPGSPRPKAPQPPAEWTKYVELERDRGTAEMQAEGPQFKAKPEAERLGLKRQADLARARYFAEVPKLFRKLIADRPNDPFAYEAAMNLFTIFIKDLKPPAAEVDAWAKAARTFAATHGPQFESATLGNITNRLVRYPEYAAQARTYAAEADKLAVAAGMPAEHVARVAEYDEERAAWAAQPNPPAADATWTVTLTGTVTDAKGDPIADAEVLVNNTQWVKTLTDDGSYKTKTGPDGRYTITLKCQGTFRLHVTRVWAEKRGFVRADNTERHKLLPGQSATINFTLTPGEPFGGTLNVRPDAWDRDRGPDYKPSHFLTITGPGVSETVLATNGEKFELTLPPGTYTVELDRGGGKKLTWSGLKTGKTDHLFEESPFRFTPETVGAGFDQVWQSMDRSYSYFALKPDVDWAKLRDEYRPKAVRAQSAGELAEVLKEMLGHLKDGHVWIDMPDGKTIGTHRSPWAYNGNRKAILAQLTDTTECGGYAVVGRTKPDGFGYFLMTQQSAATPELVAKAVAAIEKLADAPGFVIDLRNANGGSEPLAQEVARLFCEKKVVYAKSRFRNGKGHDDFTEDQPRELPPAKSGRPYLKPVVCLLGPGCVSSGEGFAQMLAALPHVTTVGLPTRGSSGNPSAVEVGETGLVVYFSRWVDLLPDGTPIEGKGVPPGVRVEFPADAYKDADPTLAKGLEVLRAKAGGKK
jgi:RNA polymerase sigma factor (sigma-70 family)